MSHKRTRFLSESGSSAVPNPLPTPASAAATSISTLSSSVNGTVLEQKVDDSNTSISVEEKDESEERPRIRRKFEEEKEASKDRAADDSINDAKARNTTDTNADVEMKDVGTSESEATGDSAHLQVDIDHAKVATVSALAAVASSSSSQVSHFTRVMDRLCMSEMMQYMTIEERLRTMRVSTLWRRTLELPSLWIDQEFEECGGVTIPNWYLDDTVSNKSLRVISDWIMQRIVRLRIKASRLLHVVSLTRVRHLALLEDDPPSNVLSATNATLERANMRVALHAISELQSLTIEPLWLHSDQMSTWDVIFKSTPIMNVTNQPALWNWCDTLKELTLPRLSIAFSCLMQRTWSKLESLTFSTLLSLQEIVQLKQLLSDPLRFLVLHSFQGRGNFETEAQYHSMNLFLRSLPFRRLSFWLHGPGKMIRQIQSLSPNLDRFILLPHLIEVPLTEGARMHEWQCLLQMHQIHTLDIENISALSISALEVFEAISSELMPQLHTIAITQLTTSSIQDTIGNTRIREIMMGMTTLTSLSVKYFFVDQATHNASFHWLNHLHTFPSLLILKLGVYKESVSINHTSLKWSDQRFKRLWPELECAIIHCTRLRQFTLPSFMTEKHGYHSHMPIMLPLIDKWRQRATYHEVRLDKLKLTFLHGDELLSDAIRHLAALPHLTDLSIHVMRKSTLSLPKLTYGESRFKPTHKEGLYFYQLVKLRHLRHLVIDDHYNKVNYDVLECWCEGDEVTKVMHHFPHLESLTVLGCADSVRYTEASDSEMDSDEDDDADATWERLIDLPRLSFIHIDDPDSDIADDVRNANHDGRTPFLCLTSPTGNVYKSAQCFSTPPSSFESDA